MLQRVFQRGNVGLGLFDARLVAGEDDIDRHDRGKQADDDDDDEQLDQREAVFRRIRRKNPKPSSADRR